MSSVFCALSSTYLVICVCLDKGMLKSAVCRFLSTEDRVFDIVESFYVHAFVQVRHVPCNHVVSFFRCHLSEKCAFLLVVFTKWDCFRLLSISLLLSTCGKKDIASGFSMRNREKQNKYRTVPHRCARMGIGSIVVQAKFEVWRKRWSQGLFVSPQSALCFFFFV